MAIVDDLRKTLQLYDEGLITNGEVSARLIEQLVTPHVKAVAETGEESGHFICGCFNRDYEPTIYRAIVEVGATQKPVWFYPIEGAAMSGHKPWSEIKHKTGFFRRMKNWFITRGILVLMRVSEFRAKFGGK